MREIKEITEGAFWVKPYSEQTVLDFFPGYTNQAILTSVDNVEILDDTQYFDWDEVFEDIIGERKEAWNILSDL